MYAASLLNCPALRICSFVISKGSYLDAHVVLFLKRVPFADISIQFKKATKTPKRLDVIFNGDPVKASTSNTDDKDGITFRWALDRELYASFISANRVLTPAIRLAAACLRISEPTTRSLFEYRTARGEVASRLETVESKSFGLHPRTSQTSSNSHRQMVSDRIFHSFNVLTINRNLIFRTKLFCNASSDYGLHRGGTVLNLTYSSVAFQHILSLDSRDGTKRRTGSSASCSGRHYLERFVFAKCTAA